MAREHPRLLGVHCGFGEHSRLPCARGGKSRSANAHCETALRAAAAEILALIDSLRNHGAADLLESGDVCARFKVITKTIFLGSPDAALID